MSGTTSVPTPTFGPNGFVAPAESAILTGVQADINAAFGGNLNPALNTPQGQLASSTAAIIGDANAQFVALANGVDPAYAAGRMQDGIARIYFLTRNPALPTALQVTCNGLAGVVIPVGALIADPLGNIYGCTQPGVIAPGGNVQLAFAAQATGPLAVPAQVAIYQAIPGWNSVAVVSGVSGNVVESRSDFEFRRQNSVAQNAVGVLTAIQGTVLSVPGVLDAYTTENSTGSPVTTGGVTLVANSLYVCVAGGASAAIAAAIWSKKNPGCAYTGNVTVTVTDTNSGYSLPYPTYTVKYQSAVSISFAMTVTLKNSTAVPSTATAQIQAAVAAAFVGADGGPRARIGSTVFASRFYQAVAVLGSWAHIVSILIGSSAVTAATFTASISGSTLTVSAVATGALAVGQTLFGAGLGGGVIITALGSGTGGTGTYTVSNPVTVASTAMTAIVTTLNSQTMGISQIPVLDPSDVNVVLV